MRVVRGLVQEEVVDDDAFHRGQCSHHVLGVGIGLQNVLALHIDAHEGAFDRGVEHVGNAQARLGVELDVPQCFELVAHGVAGDVAVAGQLVRNEPMSQEPCTLFWPRSGFTPTPGRPILPVAIARLAIAITVVEPGCAR